MRHQTTLFKNGLTMHAQSPFTVLAAMAICTVLTDKATAQGAKDIRGASPLVAVEMKHRQN